MSTPDPGLDRHEWETEYASLDAAMHDDPEQGLPELADLVERMLRERGLDPDEPGNDREIVAEYRSARELSDLAERGDADPGDVAAAIQSLRTIFETIVAERSAP
jgi:hypothetical protein